ncbi:MAG: DUF1641 domain-containing protein [Myxococcota bacterium]
MGTVDERLSERLDRVERSLQRVEALLSVRLSAPNGTARPNGNGHSNGHSNGNGSANGNGHSNGHGNGHANGNGNGHSLFELAALQASQQLSSVEGEGPVRTRLTETLVRLGDPETLGAITRLAEVAPQLEYAVHALAAGPELLEELTQNLDEWAKKQGMDDGGRARLQAGQRALMVLSQPLTLRSVERIAHAAPHLTPAADGLAQGLEALVRHEGEAAFRERIAETIVRVGEAEALDSLARIVALAPKLEYAVHALAAGPELLEEALDVLKERTGDSADLQRRITDATETLTALSEPHAQRALRGVVQAIPPLAPALGAASRAFGRVGEVHGEAVEEGLEEVMLRLAEPETLDALGNLLVLLPKLEYLAHVGAAGPELLEEMLDVVREKTGDVPTAELGQAGGDLLAAVLDPAILRSLAGLARGLAGEDGSRLLRRLDTEALVRLGGQAAALPTALEEAARNAGYASTSELEPNAKAALRLALRVSTPDRLDRLGDIVESLDLEEVDKLLRTTSIAKIRHVLGAVDLDAAATLAEYAGPVAHIAEEIPWGSLEAYLDLAKKPEITLGLHRLLELAPSLVGPLEALPVQTRTLHLLSTVNQAIEAAAEAPPRKGAFGVLGALRDPDVQAALGVAIEVARRAGQALRQGPPKELTAGE